MIYKITRLFFAFCLVANIANAQINEVLLTFIPEGSGSTVTARAQNTGSGLQVVNNINLVESTAYTLRISLGDAITQFVAIQDQIRFFFETSDDLFKGTFKTNDTDSNGLPVGFSTAWNTACLDENETGTFRIALRNLGSSKAAGNNITDGTGVFDLSWNITVANDPTAPSCENEEEIITDVILTFTPVDGGEPVIARAQDPDGEGVLDLEVLDDIVLDESTTYILTIKLLNSIEDEDITEEIEEEADEHMFFFGFTEGLFRSPSGDGNIDNRADNINYLDFDDDGLPLGLSTRWVTACLEEGNKTGTFRVVLKHQPGVKSATSTVEDGETDIDLTWNIRIIDDPRAPSCENEEEVITDVILTFTPVNGGEPVIARAQDPDGEGVLDLEILDDIVLEADKSYVLTIELLNTIEDEDITKEIEEEADEHMFFFQWTQGVFSDPTGNGNVDNRNDPVNYNDFDDNNLPLGLSTNWTTSVTLTEGEFRVVLKHQPGVKSATSTVEDGETDIDLTWKIRTILSNTKTLVADAMQLYISPNPTSEWLNWTVQGQSYNEFDLSIYDQLGRLVETHKATTPSINIAHLPSGVYVFQLRNNSTIWTKQFVKK
jgi:hypothetical protein